MQLTERPYGRVQFPRFEHETNPDLDISERKLIQLARPQEWLPPILTTLILESARLPGETRNEMKQTGWWGLYHRVREHASPPIQWLSSVTLRQEAIQSRVRHHDYEWDVQSMPGTATEVVLEHTERGGTWEVAALLIPNRRPTAQRLVINNPEGWHEPFEDELDSAQSFLFAMTRIALGEVNAHAVDKRRASL